MSNYSQPFIDRLAKLRNGFGDHQAVLISSPTDIRYFCGFETLVPAEREALLVVTKSTTMLFYAHFSPFKPVEGVGTQKGVSLQAIKQLLEKEKTENSLTELLIDESNVVVSELNQLTAAISVGALDHRLIWQLRTIKDDAELTLMRQAADCAKKTMAEVVKTIKLDQTELEVCDIIERKLKQLGSEAPAFPTIVAFGPHSALPHHQPTSQKLIKDTAVLLDFGATFGGYCSDMTRTIWCGDTPSQKFKELETIVMKAYQAALKTAQPPEKRTAQALDKSARDVINELGYGEQFIHTTGHGVGLDIHEPPSLNWNNGSRLEEHMTITIEPGIYLEGEFGYRYENTIHITNTSAEELTV